MGKASGKHSAPVWRTGNTSTVRHTGAFIIVGIALIAVAVAMVTSGVFADLTASQASAKVLAQLDEVRPEPHAATMRKRERGEDWLGREESDSMPTVVIDGYEYLGSLHIASLDLNLPVAAMSSSDGVLAATRGAMSTLTSSSVGRVTQAILVE